MSHLDLSRDYSNFTNAYPYSLSLVRRYTAKGFVNRLSVAKGETVPFRKRNEDLPQSENPRIGTRLSGGISLRGFVITTNDKRLTSRYRGSSPKVGNSTLRKMPREKPINNRRYLRYGPRQIIEKDLIMHKEGASLTKGLIWSRMQISCILRGGPVK